MDEEQSDRLTAAIEALSNEVQELKTQMVGANNIGRERNNILAKSLRDLSHTIRTKR